VSLRPHADPVRGGAALPWPVPRPGDSVLGSCLCLEFPWCLVCWCSHSPRFESSAGCLYTGPDRCRVGRAVEFIGSLHSLKD
jgi:hypothetical protein